MDWCQCQCPGVVRLDAGVPCAGGPRSVQQQVFCPLCRPLQWRSQRRLVFLVLLPSFLFPSLLRARSRTTAGSSCNPTCLPPTFISHLAYPLRSLPYLTFSPAPRFNLISRLMPKGRLGARVPGFMLNCLAAKDLPDSPKARAEPAKQDDEFCLPTLTRSCFHKFLACQPPFITPLSSPGAIPTIPTPRIDGTNRSQALPSSALKDESLAILTTRELPLELSVPVN